MKNVRNTMSEDEKCEVKKSEVPSIVKNIPGQNQGLNGLRETAAVLCEHFMYNGYSRRQFH